MNVARRNATWRLVLFKFTARFHSTAVLWVKTIDNQPTYGSSFDNFHKHYKAKCVGRICWKKIYTRNNTGPQSWA